MNKVACLLCNSTWKRSSEVNGNIMRNFSNLLECFVFSDAEIDGNAERLKVKLNDSAGDARIRLPYQAWDFPRIKSASQTSLPKIYCQAHVELYIWREIYENWFLLWGESFASVGEEKLTPTDSVSRRKIVLTVRFSTGTTSSVLIRRVSSLYDEKGEKKTS